MKSTYRWTCVYGDAHTLEVLIKCFVEVDVQLSRSNNQIVRTWLDKVHQLQSMRLNFVSFEHVPHEVAIREYNDTAWDPVVIHKKLTVLHTVDFHSIQT